MNEGDHFILDGSTESNLRSRWARKWKPCPIPPRINHGLKTMPPSNRYLIFQPWILGVLERDSNRESNRDCHWVHTQTSCTSFEKGCFDQGCQEGSTESMRWWLSGVPDRSLVFSGQNWPSIHPISSWQPSTGKLFSRLIFIFRQAHGLTALHLNRLMKLDFYESKEKLNYEKNDAFFRQKAAKVAKDNQGPIECVSAMCQEIGTGF